MEGPLAEDPIDSAGSSRIAVEMPAGGLHGPENAF
jgi:hypothetical protein